MARHFREHKINLCKLISKPGKFHPFPTHNTFCVTDVQIYEPLQHDLKLISLPRNLEDAGISLCHGLHSKPEIIVCFSNKTPTNHFEMLAHFRYDTHFQPICTQHLNSCAKPTFIIFLEKAFTAVESVINYSSRLTEQQLLDFA